MKLILAVALLFCQAVTAQVSLQNAKLQNANLSQPPPSGGGCVNAYRAAPGVGTGDRTGFMTVTYAEAASGNTSSLLNSSGQSLINGSTGSSVNFFNNGIAVDGSDGSTGPYWIQFDLGSGKVLTQAKYYQQNTTSQGTWEFQGCNNGSNDGSGSGTWVDIGTSFTLVVSTTTTLTSMAANTTSYRYYRILGVSGTTSFSPFIYQFEFQNCQ